MIALAAAVAFVWLGMVLALSFLEAPLKFRAPGVTLPLGLGIGRLVFAVFNRVELVLLGVVAVALLLSPVRPAGVLWSAGAAAVVLAIQLAVVRPVLTRRSDLVLAGAEVPRSRAHVGYIVLEVLKVAALVVVGGTALAAVA